MVATAEVTASRHGQTSAKTAVRMPADAENPATSAVSGRTRMTGSPCAAEAGHLLGVRFLSGRRGMLIVETVARIRREHFVKGKTIREIARDLKLSRNTVRKVLRSGETCFD
jgi:hypothetical protein